MDLAIFAVAFSVIKLHRKKENAGKNTSGPQKTSVFLSFSAVFVFYAAGLAKIEESVREKILFAS